MVEGGLMRISDLSHQSDVPVPTIKFYLREHLLPPGRSTGRNQAVYGDVHLRRLRLIKAFATIGQLDLASVRELITAIEDERLPLADLYDVVNRAVVPDGVPPDDTGSLVDARIDADRFVEEFGWSTRSDSPARANLALVLASLRRLGCDLDMDFFTSYATAADRLVTQELALLPSAGTDRAAAVARSVLLDVAFAALRHIAQEHHVARRFGRPTPPPGDAP
jgi:DNA-binding transcriptional MerR regulator